LGVSAEYKNSAKNQIMASGNMKDIKRRIKSVESTKQITKAMQLVASSKLRRAKERAESAQPFFAALFETMARIQAENKDFSSVFTRNAEKSKHLLIVIAGDRGLAGGFNSNIIKLALERTEAIGKKNVKILSIGKKAVEYFKKHEFDVLSEYPGIAEGMKIHTATHMVRLVMKAFSDGEISNVELIFTTYVSPLTQTANVKQILPIEIQETEIAQKPAVAQLPVYEPSAEAVFNGIVPKYISGVIFSAVVDSFASEQAARRNAMENATENAETMISDLSLLYNRARQASITQEITEIIGGSQ
jgi:F-type H+-transporting ATPase subunit gamma